MKENKKVRNENKKLKSKNKLKNILKKQIDFNVNFTVVAIVLIVIFCICITPVTFQNDTYYTIKIGELIKTNGIDMMDHFSWHENVSYTYPHWLYDLLTYKVYSMFGFVGIYVATVILACVLGITIYKVNCKISKSNIVSFFTTIGSMYILKGFISARAQLVTFILFILTIYFIEMFLKNKKWKYAIGLIIIPILIANLHCAVWPFYFVLYLPYIGEYFIAIIADTIIYRKLEKKILNIKIKVLSKNSKKANQVIKLKKELVELEEKIKKVKQKRKENLKNPYKIYMKRNPNVKWLIVIMVICSLTGLLTPLGNTPYTYLIKTMQGNTTQNINEHLPMILTEQIPALCTILIFLSILTFTKTKIRLSDLFMLGGLCLLMLNSRRQLSMFAIICSVILSKLIVELIEKHEFKKGALKKITKEITSKTGTIILLLCMSLLSYYFAKDKVNEKIIDEKTYPVQACDYIINNIDLGKAKFYNEYNYGSYMLYRNIPVFIDSRADLYAPEFSGLQDDIFMDFIETSGISVFYEDIFEKYGITHVIAYKDSKVNMIINKSNDLNYKQLYCDDNFVIYERLNSNFGGE